MSFFSYANKKGVDYLELKTRNEKVTKIETQNKEIKEAELLEDTLYAVRVLYKGSFGVAYSSEENFKELINKAVKIARQLKKKIKITPPKVSINKKTLFKKDPEDVSIEKKSKDILGSINLKEHKKIKSLKTIYSDRKSNYHIQTSSGLDSSYEDVRFTFICLAYSSEGNLNESFFKSLASRGGYEHISKVQETLNNCMKIAQELLKAKCAIGGNFPVIADQDLGGVFTHEAVGHACEADIVLKGKSVLRDKLNKKIGSNNLNILDDGTLNEWGGLYFDDEGIKPERTILIKNGILKNFMTNLETASILKKEPTGNGRAQSLAFQPIPRMTCTFIENQDSSFDEMASSIKNGYYLKGTGGGQVNTATGEFLFNSKYGYFIKNGRLSHMVKGASLMGDILEILPKISMIGKDRTFNTGTCGKASQSVSVSDGSPHIKIDLAKVGGKL